MLPRQRRDGSGRLVSKERVQVGYHGGEPRDIDLTRRALSEMSLEFSTVQFLMSPMNLEPVLSVFSLLATGCLLGLLLVF